MYLCKFKTEKHEAIPSREESTHVRTYLARCWKVKYANLRHASSVECVKLKDANTA